MTSLGFVTAGGPVLGRCGSRRGVCSARKAVVVCSAAPSPEVYAPNFPEPKAFRAPMITMFDDALVVEMAKVPLDAKPEDDPEAPDPALYEEFYKGREINAAPFIDMTCYAAEDSEAPSEGSYPRYAGKPWLNKAPFIEMSSSGDALSLAMRDVALENVFDPQVGRPVECSTDAGIGVEMKTIGLDISSELPDPKKYEPFLGEYLNQAPVVSIFYNKYRKQDSVVKVSWEAIDGAGIAESVDAEYNPSETLYPTFDNDFLNKAPVISIVRGEDDESSSVKMELEDIEPASLNTAPVIEFDGQEGFTISRKTIYGNPDDVETAFPSDTEARSTWTPDWRPTDVTAKKYV